MQRRIIFATIIVLAYAVAVPAAAGEQQGAAITYSLPKDGIVTLNVSRPDGWVVRELVVGQKQAAACRRPRR